MRRPMLAVFAILWACSFAASAKQAMPSKDEVIQSTRFLEEHPRDERAPGLRAVLLAWEDKSKDVVDYVCNDVLDPLPADGVPNGGELLAQFIFGGAAFQLSHPEQKGKLQPSQLAGMRSLLKAYQSLLASDPGARITRFDELSAKDADGSLPAYLEPIVAKGCDQG